MSDNGVLVWRPGGSIVREDSIYEQTKKVLNDVYALQSLYKLDSTLLNANKGSYRKEIKDDREGIKVNIVFYG
jgi:hypothetical protein